jgi:uncharacterized membrane protein
VLHAKLQQTKNLDLIIVAALGVIGIALAFSGLESGIIRFAFGLPLMLILPGYALVAAFAGGALGIAERVVLVIGLSLGTAAVGGLLLNFLPWGLTPVSWALWFGLITLVGGIATLVRRRNATTVTGASVTGTSRDWTMGLNPKQAGLLGAAAVIAIAALLVARAGVEDQTSRFTQFYMLPDETNRTSVKLGVVSTEAATTKYILKLEAGGRVLQEWSNIELKPGERWEQTLTVPQPEPGKSAVEAKLYKASAPNEVYRYVSFKQ